METIKSGTKGPTECPAALTGYRRGFEHGDDPSNNNRNQQSRSELGAE